LHNHKLQGLRSEFKSGELRIDAKPGVRVTPQTERFKSWMGT
jgi:hypothetical protein